MKKPYTRVIVGIVVVALGAAIAVLLYGFRLASIGTAYTAKILCSGIFVSQRNPESLLDNDLSADDLSILRNLDVQVDRGSREVTATLFGLAKRKAVYSEGRGCIVGLGEIAKLAESPQGSPDRVPGQQAATGQFEAADKLAPELGQG
jgi:hypothetical protein